MPLKDVFFVGNFVEKLPSNSSRYLTQMYDQAREIEQAYASYHHLLRLGDTKGAKAVFASERENLIKHPALENLKRAESLLNQQLQWGQRPHGDERRGETGEARSALRAQESAG
jgi:hypothetical protein